MASYAKALVSGIARDRDNQTSYYRGPLRAPQDLNGRQICAYIFSFLPKESKRAVTLTCQLFQEILKEGEAARIQAMIRFIDENYLIFGTNTDPTLSLEKKIEKGVVFLLASNTQKASHKKVHVAFMQAAIHCSTAILTQECPCAMTLDERLLGQAELWYMGENGSVQVADYGQSLLPPENFPSELYRLMVETKKDAEYVIIGMTLLYFHLVEETQTSTFFKMVQFFSQFYGIEEAVKMPAFVEIMAMGEGLVDFTRPKSEMLLLVLEGIVKVIDRMNQKVNALDLLDSYKEATCLATKMNALLVKKISEQFSPGKTVIAEGPVFHFFNEDGVVNLFLEGKKISQGFPDSIAALAKAKIPYIGLYPKEPLIAYHFFKEELNNPNYHHLISFYIGLDFSLAETPGTNQELQNNGASSYLSTIFTHNQLEAYFTQFLTHPHSDKIGFPWRAAGFLVCERALENWIAQNLK